MIEHAIPALEVVLVFITIYMHIFSLKTLKLHAWNPNLAQTLICYYRPKLRFFSLTSDTKTCFRETNIYKSTYSTSSSLQSRFTIPLTAIRFEFLYPWILLPNTGKIPDKIICPALACLHFFSLTSDTKTCFRETMNTSEQISTILST